MSLPATHDKRRFVERMFDGIAPRYALMNRLMSLGADRSWRRETIASLALDPGEIVVDLGCGTGELLVGAAARRALVVGVDISVGMLRKARERVPAGSLLRADAERLPLRSGSVDAIVSAFALRNFTSVAEALSESSRVLRPGGRIALLEVDLPTATAPRLAFDLYFKRLVPLLGRALSKGFAYRYLAESLAYLPSESELRCFLLAAGFEQVAKRRLMRGAAQLVTARLRAN